MLKILYDAGCFGLPPAIWAQFTLEMRVAGRNCEKFTKPFVLKFQGHLRSSMLIFIRSSSPALVMISSMSVPICNHFHVSRANSGKITPFKEGCPFFAPSFVGIPFTQRHEIFLRNTRALGYDMLKTRTLPHLGCNWYRVVTGGQTGRITVANTPYNCASSCA